MRACNSAISTSTKSGTERGLGPWRRKQQSSSSVLSTRLEFTQEGLQAAEPLSISLRLLKGFIARVSQREHGTPPPPSSEIPRYFGSGSELTCLILQIWCSELTLSLTARYMEVHKKSNVPKSTKTLFHSWPSRLHIPLPPASSSSHPTQSTGIILGQWQGIPWHFPQGWAFRNICSVSCYVTHGLLDRRAQWLKKKQWSETSKYAYNKKF